MKNFIIRLILLFFVVTIFTIGFNYIYLKIDTTDEDNINKYITMPKNINICNFGSSHGLYGFNYDSINNKKYIPFNFALASQSISYDFRILRHYKDNLANGATIYIPVSYFSLIGLEEEKYNDFLSINRRYYKILPKNLIKQYDFTTKIFVTKLPALIAYEKIANVIINAIFDRVPDVLEEWRKGDATKIPNIDKIAKWRAEAHLAGKNLDEHGKLITNYYEVNELINMIDYCNNHNFNTILVTTPLLDEYNYYCDIINDKFRNKFNEFLCNLAQEKNIKYYNYSNDERFGKSYNLFMDPDHMNENGARLFVKILLKETINN